MKQVIIALILCVLAIYLFVAAPPQLPDESAIRAAEGPAIPVRVLLDSANLVNAAARRIYTERVVTPGQKAGLVFSEEWRSSEAEAGPLPAVFLRMVAARLQDRRASLALFLGSDQPINPSNVFKGEQAQQFQALKADGKPRYFGMPERGIQVALYADVAATHGCVTCHNNHPASPKSDWRLGDVMGAATWTYPRDTVSDRELRQGIAQVYDAVREAYLAYLDRARQFSRPPAIGSGWPERGNRRIPDSETFMAAVREETASAILDAAVLMR